MGSEMKTPKADCMKCRGACCESLVFPRQGLSQTTAAFMEVRCGRTVWLRPGEKGFEIETRCPHLTDDGLCAIHEDRPMVCEFYVAGGEACIETVKRRRAHLMDEILGIKKRG
jgi:Fe-S-cluster containining protein